MIQNNSNGGATRDTTIDEIHLTRERMAEKHGGIVAAIVEDARRRQAASGRAMWRQPMTTKALHPPKG
jgi:hypothetical protein